MNKINAILYIIYRVAQQFNGYNNVDKNDIAFFNANNNFNIDKCLMLPYIITIANGKKNEFLDDEGIFKNSFLPVFEDSQRVLIGDINEVFQVYSSADLNLNFNERGFLNVDSQFFNEKKYSIDTDIKNNIEYSIKFFEEKRFPEFSAYDSSLLGLITSQNSAFDVIKNFCTARNIVDPTKKAVLFNIVAKESFYFTYFNDRLEEDTKFEYA